MILVSSSQHELDGLRIGYVRRSVIFLVAFTGSDRLFENAATDGQRGSDVGPGERWGSMVHGEYVNVDLWTDFIARDKVG